MSLPPGPHFTEDQFWRALGGAARAAAVLIAAMGVVWGALWYAFQPRIDSYFDRKLDEFRVEIGQITNQLTRIENALPGPRPFIEFATGGRIPYGDYASGSNVTFLYYLRRNRGCPTVIRAQFWSYETNSLAGEYTYDFSAIQATPSLEFGLFSARVRLPEGMAPGAYAYAPLMIPDTDVCPGELPLQAPPSDFFYVSSP